MHKFKGPMFNTINAKLLFFLSIAFLLSIIANFIIMDWVIQDFHKKQNSENFKFIELAVQSFIKQEQLSLPQQRYLQEQFSKSLQTLEESNQKRFNQFQQSIQLVFWGINIALFLFFVSIYEITFRKLVLSPLHSLQNETLSPLPPAPSPPFLNPNREWRTLGQKIIDLKKNLQRRKTELEMLNEMGEILSGRVGKQSTMFEEQQSTVFEEQQSTMFDKFFKLIQEKTSTNWGAVYLFNQEGKIKSQTSYPSDGSQLYEEQVKLIGSEKDLFQQAALKKEKFYIKTSSFSLFCLPLFDHNQLFGLIVVSSPSQNHSFEDVEQEWFQTLTQFTIIAIQKTRLQEIVEKQNETLESKIQEHTKELNDTLKQLEEQNNHIKKAQSHLIQSEKLASLGTVVAGIAHEINNPVTFIYNGAYNLSRLLRELREFLLNLAKQAEDEGAAEIFEEQFIPLFQELESVSVGSQRVQKIVLSLRTFSRLDEGERKRTQLVDGLKSTLNLVIPNYHEQVSFSTNFQDDPELECWPAELNQVFMNLIINACQAIRMRQEEENDPTPGKLKVSSIVENRHLKIEFEDTGCGIPEEIQKNIFDPFFTTKKIGEGTGLGLSISFGIVKKHEGKIQIQSGIEEGSKFSILLPLPEP